MTRNVPFKLLILLCIFSCTKDKDFETQSYPILRTLSVTRISPDGATLNGEFLNLGQEEILSYGFVFEPVISDLRSVDTIIITKKANEGNYSITLDDAFADSLEYNVRAFAICTNRIVYGNTVKFQSQGGKWNPWIFCAQADVDYPELISASNNENAFVVTTYGYLYFFNPDANTLTPCVDVPDEDPTGIYGHDFACYFKGNYFYNLSINDRKFLRFDITDNTWLDLETPMPVLSHRKYGFVLNDNGYIISTGSLYFYNEANNSFINKAALSATNIIYSALVADNNLYVVTDNQEIWKYTPLSDSWQKETAYPGSWHGYIMGFSVNNRLYYGLSYTVYGSSLLPAKDFWEYSIDTKTWKKMKNFPIYHSKSGMVNFTIKGRGFLGYFNYGLHKLILFKFDPNKIKP